MKNVKIKGLMAMASNTNENQLLDQNLFMPRRYLMKLIMEIKVSKFYQWYE